jgi:hypothetical protein
MQQLLVIEPKFLQNRSRKAGQREFGLFRLAGNQIPLQDIRHALPGGTNHPSMDLAALFKVTIAESDGCGIKQSCSPEAFRRSVSPMPGDKWFCTQDFPDHMFLEIHLVPLPQSPRIVLIDWLTS